MKNVIVAVVMLLSANAATAQMTVANNVASPIIAASNASIKNATLDPAMSDGWLDAPMSAMGNNYFLSTHSLDSSNYPEPESLRHVMTFGNGNYDTPYASEQWVKRTCQRSGHFCTNQTSGSYAFTSLASGLTNVVNLWFVSVYNPGGSERLAFVHEENAGWTGFVPNTNWEGKTRIGLAYSADSGNTWKYLGRIASPYSEKQPWNIQGAPYMVVNGSFYVWYWDYDGSGDGYAVSKANIANVLAAARTGSLGTNLWQKKTATGWSTNIAAMPAFPAGPQAEGIVHSQAAHASDGNYYLVTTAMTGMPWTSTASYVELFTVDPSSLAWTHVMNIVSEPTASFVPDSGYQYASIVDPSGNANGEVGSSFYLYSGKFQNQNTPPYIEALYQWQLYLTPPANFYKESKDFSSTQGANDWNYAAVLSGDYMTWNGSYWWQPSDQFNRILNGGMSTGSNDGFLLIWVAPKTGSVTVRQTVRTSQPTANCGDGVNVAFQHNTTLLMSGAIAWNDTIGLGPTTTIAVNAGDALYFYGTKGANNYCDGLFWDPSILYN